MLTVSPSVYLRYMESAALEQLGRGVWWAPWRTNGCPVLVAITAAGERVKQLRVLPHADTADLIRRLERYLDEIDPPRPALSLVKEGDPAPGPRFLTVEELDRIYRDASPVASMLYQRKREKLKGMLPPLPRFG